MRRHRNRFAFALFLFLTSLTTIAYAQGGDPPPGLEPTLRFSHLTTDDGLVQNSISAILQDRRGFMWIGTQNGLSRFDGYSFITYQHDPDNPNSLHNNSISSLIEDEQGRIWIVGREGVTVFDPLTETFTPYRLNLNGPPGLAVLRPPVYLNWNQPPKPSSLIFAALIIQRDFKEAGFGKLPRILPKICGSPPTML